MTPRQRLLLMLPVLAVAGWLALFGDKTPPEARVVAVSSRVAPAVPAAEQSVAAEPAADEAAAVQADLPPGQIRRLGSRAGLVDQGRSGQDLFDGRGAAPPPPPPPPPPQEVAPPPPERPFQLIGRMLEAGRWTVFLERNGHAWAVGLGGEADGFRVEEISGVEVRVQRLSDKAVFVIPIDGDKKD